MIRVTAADWVQVQWNAVRVDQWTASVDHHGGKGRKAKGRRSSHANLNVAAAGSLRRKLQ